MTSSGLNPKTAEATEGVQIKKINEKTRQWTLDADGCKEGETGRKLRYAGKRIARTRKRKKKINRESHQ